MQVAPYKNESDKAAMAHVCASMLSYSSVSRARSRLHGLNRIWRIKLELYRRAKVETRRVNLTLFATSANRLLRKMQKCKAENNISYLCKLGFAKH